MQYRIVLFDDTKLERNQMVATLEQAGHIVLAFGQSALSENDIESIKSFRPNAAIVDCWYDNELGGLKIIESLIGHFPDLKIVACSILFDGSNDGKRLAKKYLGLDGVVDAVPKRPTPPTAEDLVRKL